MKNKIDVLEPVTEELSEKVEIFRSADGGFQRRLRRQRLGEISETICSGVYCPPITIADVDGRYLLVDGQHRLAAWRNKPFNLSATITKMDSVGEAMHAFIAMNREQKKVPLGHILSVSDDNYAVKLRRMAKECSVSLPHIHNLMCGVLNSKNPQKQEITEAQWKVAAKVMAYWTKDRRWGRPGNSFSTAGVLKLVGFFAGKSTAVDSILKDISALDFSFSGQLGRIAGTSWASQGHMKQIVYKVLAEKII